MFLYLTMKEAIIAHLELYRSQKDLDPVERSLSLVAIAESLEDTINKMTKRTAKQEEKPQVTKFVFRGYAVSPSLDKEDKDAIGDLAADVDGLAAGLSELVEKGYSVKCSFDFERKAYQAYLSATGGENDGLVLGMYGRDFLRALAAVYFAHKNLLGGKWKKKGDVDSSDIA